MNGTETFGDAETSPSTAVIAEIVLRSLVYAVGVVGNLMVIFFILILREYKKVTHWYVLQLALADFIFLQTLPFKISEIMHKAWLYSLWACKAKQTVLFFNYYSSILFLMIMAVDRYLAVCHGFSSRVQRWRSNKSAYIITAITWITALLMCIPVMIYTEEVGSKGSCKCALYFPKDAGIVCRAEGFDENLNKTAYDQCVKPKRELYSKSPCFDLTSMFGSTSDGNDGANNSGGGIDIYSYFGDSGNDDNGSGSIDLYAYLDSLLPEYSNLEETTTPTTTYTIADNCIYDNDRPGWTVFVYFNFVVMFVIPFLAIAICYTLIAIRLQNTMAGSRKSSTADAYHSSTDGSRKFSKSKRSMSVTSSRSHREKKRVNVMCAVLVLLFVICWLPFHAVHLAKMQGIRNASVATCDTLSVVSFVLAYLNSALNPYLYNFLGTFKKRLRQVRQHSGVQTFLSATGLTRLAVPRSDSGTASFSEGTRTKRPSYPNDNLTTGPQESIPLKNMNGQNNVIQTKL